MKKNNTKTKTWKIGEVCQGGIITVEITGKIISVIGKEWDFAAGTRKGSNQSNAREFTRGTIDATERNAINKIDDFICELSTTYWSDTIITWIKSQIKFGGERI